jgi:hypothetical protein
VKPVIRAAFVMGDCDDPDPIGFDGVHEAVGESSERLSVYFFAKELIRLGVGNNLLL